MATRTTNLALYTGSAARAVSRPTRLMNPQTNLLRTLGTTWKSMDGNTKSGWLQLAKSLAADTLPNNKNRVSGYSTFVGIASIQVAAGLPIPLLAPNYNTRPAPLPGIVLQVDGFGNNLSMTLDPQVNFAGHVLIYGARPLLLGQNVYDKMAFKMLGKINALTGPTQMANLYMNHFNVPSHGYQIALKCYSLSTTGLRNGPLIITGNNIALSAPNLTIG